MEKVLTVVVPAYNAETDIRDNLESFCIPGILEKIEILVVDDGSTDRTGEIAEKYAKWYPDSFRVIHKENGGHGSGINYGISHASGFYFKVVDADDWVNKEAFAKLVRVLEEQISSGRSGKGKKGKAPADIVSSGFLWAVEKKSRTKGKRYIFRSPRKNINNGVKYGRVYRFDEIAEKTYIRMHNMTIRTAILQEHNILLDEKCFYVDLEYITYPIPWVKTVCFIDANVYRYRIGRSGQSVEIGQMRKNERDYDKVAASLAAFYQKLEDTIPCSLAKRKYICSIISKYMAGKIKILLSYPASAKRKRELSLFDRKLKERYPDIYDANRNPAIAILRRSRYLTYFPASMMVRWKYGR